MIKVTGIAWKKNRKVRPVTVKMTVKDYNYKKMRLECDKLLLSGYAFLDFSILNTCLFLLQKSQYFILITFRYVRATTTRKMTS